MIASAMLSAVDGAHAMFTLAHLSDLHLAVEPRGSQLLSKRGLGYINWLPQAKAHPPAATFSTP